MSVRRSQSSSFVTFESVESRMMMSGSGSSGVVYGPILSSPTVTKPLNIKGGSSSAQVDWRKSGDKSPIFDFADSYYQQNGIDPTKIAGRPNGTGGSVIDNRVQDPTRRNVRMKSLVGMHDDGGKANFFAVLGTIQANAFTNDAAGAKARQIADKYIAYIFPKAGTNQLGAGNKRQDELIPLNNGYFSNDPLQVWREAFVNYVPGSMNSGDGKKTADDLLRKNGADADGTPFIRTMSDLEKAVDAGIVTVQLRNNDGSQGAPWFFCAVFKDYSRNAITRDSTLAVARNTNGTITQSSLDIQTTFDQLQTAATL